MTGRGRELAETLRRRSVDVACIQETRWEGSAVRNLGEGYKLLYHGENNKKNGVGMVVSKKCVERIVKVERHSDRLMAVQLIVEDKIWNVFSAYTPKVGKPEEEKEEFWEKLEATLNQDPQDQELIIGGDLNTNLGDKNTHFLEEHGQMEYNTKNEEGARALETLQALNLFAINTGFKKRDEHLITYRSGNYASQIDYILVKKERRLKVKDCKVLPLEAVTRQHRLLVADFASKKEKNYMYRPKKGASKD